MRPVAGSGPGGPPCRFDKSASRQPHHSMKKGVDMILVVALAALCLVGMIGAAVASVRDSRSPMRTIWGYDSRRPLT